MGAYGAREGEGGCVRVSFCHVKSCFAAVVQACTEESDGQPPKSVAADEQVGFQSVFQIEMQTCLALQADDKLGVVSKCLDFWSPSGIPSSSKVCSEDCNAGAEEVRPTLQVVSQTIDVQVAPLQLFIRDYSSFAVYLPQSATVRCLLDAVEAKRGVARQFLLLQYKGNDKCG